MAHLEQEGFSLHHRERVIPMISHFTQFLIEQKGLIQHNPTCDIEL
jgi:hypothetical protein